MGFFLRPSFSGLLTYRIAHSIEVHEASIAEYKYPHGSYWKSVKA